MERKALGPSPLRESATSPPQTDYVLVVLFFIHGRLGGCVKAPRHPDTWVWKPDCLHLPYILFLLYHLVI